MVYSTRRFVLFFTLCHFVLVFFSPVSIAITSLGEERANLSAFRTFFFDLCLFGFVGFLFLLVSGKGCGLSLWHTLDFSLTPFFSFNKVKRFRALANYCKLSVQKRQLSADGSEYPRTIQPNWQPM